MANTYYNSAGKEVIDGDVAYAADLNAINTATNSGFNLVETAIGTLGTNYIYYSELAQDWAEAPEDTLVDATSYSAYHWARKAIDNNVLAVAAKDTAEAQAVIATSQAGNSASSASSASSSASTATTQAGTATTQAGIATAQAVIATTKASEAAASAVTAAASLPPAVHAATSKATPVDADEIPLIDSAASWGLKRLTWANLKAVLFGSPTLTGTPTAPTAPQGTDSVQVATTAFVKASRRTATTFESRAINGASGDVTYTGVGFTPSKVTIFAKIAGTLCSSVGIFDGSFFGCTTTNTVASYNDIIMSYAIKCSDPANGAKYQTDGNIVFNSDGATITWTNVGSPAAGTAISLMFVWEE